MLGSFDATDQIPLPSENIPSSDEIISNRSYLANNEFIAINLDNHEVKTSTQHHNG